MRRLRRLWRSIFPERCRWCTGRGSYRGYSPTDSLATFRHMTTLRCRYCRGSGHQVDAEATEAAEREAWRRIIAGEDAPEMFEPERDGRIIRGR